jgi:hypothetical protein
MVVQDRAPATSPNASARGINVALGVWLFISAFIWPHSLAERTNTWILGVLTVVFALVATRVPQARYMNTILAIWLFISAWALSRISVGTTWNNALVAIAIFVVSLIPSMALPGGSGMLGQRSVPGGS